MILITLFKF